MKASHWNEANQRYLTAALAIVRETLERQAGAPPRAPAATRKRRKVTTPLPALEAIAADMEAPPALEKLCATFGLSTFERGVLLLCAGVELDARIAALCAATQGDPRKTHATFGLALAALPGAHWSALSPHGPLRRWRFIDLSAGETLTAGALRLDERVLHYLAGVDGCDERLAPLLTTLVPPAELPSSQAAVSARLAALWRRAGEGAPCPVVHLGGHDPADRQAVAAAACAALGLRLRRMRAADLPAGAAERELLARVWEREALLTDSALFLECEEAESERAAAPFLESVQGIVVASGRDPLPASGRAVVRIEVGRPAPAEQHALWRQALGPAALLFNGQIEVAASHFAFGPQAIRAASAEALQQLDASEADDAGAVLWEACRRQARQRLDELAQRIEPAASWEDLVLPPEQARALRHIAIHVRQRACVYERWGFAAKSARGLGIGALFSGASGTGKTMAAEVIANELRLDLYRIDLSAMVSKYIGETEKNLRRVFDAAEEGGSILLFDEADAIFGRRSEVKDSHDRHANIEVSYLLQRIEAYRGLAILTTNMKTAIDPAFLRRLRFIVQFPFPDAPQRAEIWQRIFPRETPLDGLDYEKLSRLNLPGGHIRNLAMNAAFLAADAAEPVRMRHVLDAARGEYAKLEKSLTETEVAGWV